MKNLINSESFKNFIESVGIGCKMIFAETQNNNIHVWCKANSKNNIIFKIILNENKCIDLINSYNLYSKFEITVAYQNYLDTLKQTKLNNSL